MKEIRYVIADELGIHARPAGNLIKVASKYQCDIKIGTPTKMVDAKRIMGVMGLALKQNDEITMTFDGVDEDTAATGMETFLQENL